MLHAIAVVRRVAQPQRSLVTHKRPPPLVDGNATLIDLYELHEVPESFSLVEVNYMNEPVKGREEGVKKDQNDQNCRYRARIYAKACSQDGGKA